MDKLKEIVQGSMRWKGGERRESDGGVGLFGCKRQARPGRSGFFSGAGGSVASQRRQCRALRRGIELSYSLAGRVLSFGQ